MRADVPAERQTRSIASHYRYAYHKLSPVAANSHAMREMKFWERPAGDGLLVREFFPSQVPGRIFERYPAALAVVSDAERQTIAL